MEVDEPFAHSDEIVGRQSSFPIFSNTVLESNEMDWVFKSRLELERIARLHKKFAKDPLQYFQDTILVIKVVENTVPHRFARKAMESVAGNIILLALVSYAIVLVASFLSRLCAVIMVWVLVCRIQKIFYRRI